MIIKLMLKATGCSAVGSALALGARCREFESLHSDQQFHACYGPLAQLVRAVGS